MSDFLAMGGYGGYVWPAFIVTAVVMIGLLAVSLQRLRTKERELARLQAATGQTKGRIRKSSTEQGAAS